MNGYISNPRRRSMSMLRKTVIVLAIAAALTGGLTADAFARGGGGGGGHGGVGGTRWRLRRWRPYGRRIRRRPYGRWIRWRPCGRWVQWRPYGRWIQWRPY